MSKIRMNKTGAGLAHRKSVDILLVVEKAEIARPGAVERGHIPYQ
jgi:hypothetical protein